MIEETLRRIIEACDRNPLLVGFAHHEPTRKELQDRLDTIRAIATQAAQPALVGEPVGWRWKYEDEGSWTLCKNRPKWAHHVDVISEPLYASPTPAITDALRSSTKDPSHG